MIIDIQVTKIFYRTLIELMVAKNAMTGVRNVIKYWTRESRPQYPIKYANNLKEINK